MVNKPMKPQIMVATIISIVYIMLFSPELKGQHVEFSHSGNGNLILKEILTNEKEFTILGDNEACKGDTLELAISTGETGSWSNGENSAVTSVVVTSDTTITATLFNDIGCPFTQYLSIHSNDGPLKPIIEKHGDTLIVNNVTGEFTWYANGIIFSAGSNFIITYLTRTYTVVVTNNKGCSSISDPIDAGPVAVNPVTFEIFRMHPNPANDKIHIEIGNGPLPARILIFNSLGIIKMESVLSTTFDEINISELPPGLYTVQVTSSNGKFRSHPLIKI